MSFTMPISLTELTPFQDRFINELLSDPKRDGAKAARRAGSLSKAPGNTAGALLANPKVIKAIAERTKELGDDGKKPERVLEEISRLAYSNVQGLFDDNGELIPITQLDKGIAACISSIEVSEKFRGIGKNRQLKGYLKKIKLWDKPKALDMMCRILAMYRDELNIPGLQEFLEAMSEIDGNTKGKLPT